MNQNHVNQDMQKECQIYFNNIISDLSSQLQKNKLHMYLNIYRIWKVGGATKISTTQIFAVLLQIFNSKNKLNLFLQQKKRNGR